MSERQELIAKFRQAVERRQFDIADGYFQAAIEAGAKEMDALAPGSGDVWRNLAHTMARLSDLGAK